MTSPFEGPEKLLEIWFAPSVADLDDSASPKCGLRRVDSSVWEEMLDIVKCKVLSVVHGDEMDAYLLRSAVFSPTKVDLIESAANPLFLFPPIALFSRHAEQP
jgi:S-adenosylmethionine decarboxylase